MRFLPILSTALIGLLFFIWPIPHTIAARNLLMVGSLVLSGYLVFRNRPPPASFSQLKPAAWLCFAFSTWLIVVAVFVSGETAWSLGEIQGQWGKALLALAVGALAAVAANQGSMASGKGLLMAVIGALTVHVLYVDFVGLKGLWEAGHLAKRLPGFTEGPDKSSFLTNMLLALLLAEGLFRAACKERYLPVHGLILLLLAAAALFSSYLEAVRNGMIALVVLAVSAAVFHFHANWARIKRGALVAGALSVVLALGVFVYFYAKSDPRWQNFAQTVPLALDTGTHKAWLDDTRFAYPVLTDGSPIDQSAYLRIAFIKEGLLLVRDHPFGVGYGRNAFAHALQAKYGYEKAGHSHSGLIDLAIGAGVPGVLLWIGFMASLIWLAYRSNAAKMNYFSLALVFVVLDFNVRMLLDSINRDHALEQFIFLLGFFALMAVREDGNRPKNRHVG